MLKVKDIMTTDVETLFEDETIDLAKNIMALGRIRHLPVTDRRGRLVGLLTHRDLLRALVELYRSVGPDDFEADLLSVRAAMNTQVTTVSPDEPALRAAELIWNNKYGCVPVVENEQLVGIVTESDFVHMAMQQLGDVRM